jgi:hypothetical protein
MSTKYRVVVEGGGENLYGIEEYNGTFYVEKVNVGLLFNSRDSIGKTDSLDRALVLIKAHSGKGIKELNER